MARKPAAKVGDTFTDREGNTVEVKQYKSAMKVLVAWEGGKEQWKSAQQLRSGNFSQRTRKGKGCGVENVEQPYKQTEEVQEDWVDESETMSVTGLSGSSLFDNVEPDESYKDSDED